MNDIPADGPVRQPAEPSGRRLPLEEAPRAKDLYQALFESLDEGCCLLEVLYDELGAAVDYRLLDANPAFARQMGLTEVAGKRGRDFAPGTEAYWLDMYAHVVETGEPVRFTHHHADTSRWYEGHAARAGTEGSRQVGIVFHDVTGRQQADESLHQAAELDAFRVKLSDALQPLTDPVEIQRMAMSVLGEQLEVDRTLYAEVEPDDAHFVIADNHVRGEFPKMTGRFVLRDFGHTPNSQRGGETLVLPDVAAAGESDDHLASYLAAGVRAIIGVPLNKQGRWVASLTVHHGRPRQWTPLEVAYVRETAERMWAAVERARVEEDLRRSEERLRIAVEAAQQGTWDWDLTTQEVRWNARHFTLFGLEPRPEHPVTPADFERYVHPDDLPDVRQRLATAVAEHCVFNAEFRAVTAQGEERWMSGYGQTTEVSPDGHAQRMSGVMFDITRRKQAELQLQELAASLEQQVAHRTQALQQSRDLLQSVYDTSLVGLAVLHAVRDAQGHLEDFVFVSVNPKWAAETGRPDLVGKRYAREFPGVEPSGLLVLMRQVVETGHPQQLEYYYPYEGFDQWYSSMYVKLDDNGVVATTLNITARQQAEQERQRNLTLLQQAEQVAGLGSWSYEPATGRLLLSDGMYHLLGLPRGSPVGPNIYLERVVAEDRRQAEQFVQRVTNGTADAKATLRLYTGEQVKTVRLQTVVLRDVAGQPVQVLGVDLDISEVRRLETDNLQLRLAQQQALFEAVLDAQEAERQRFAESLHNGLGQLLYATKLQLGQLPAGPPALAHADQLLAEAIRQARTLSHELVPTVLTESGLGAALCSIARSLSGPALRIACTVELNETPPLPVPLQIALYRMAQELLQNVVKHARATHASVALETVPGFVLLRVEDNGVGFPAAQAPGAGIGLRTIRSRVALLNGTLDFGSAAPYGTHVRLRIPLPPHELPLSG
jgi:PAS domain S-box-containing protein